MDTAQNKMEQLLENSVLASPPDLLFKIINSLDAELNSRQIGEIIGRSQALSAEILKLSNSSYIGFRDGITSLDKAINVLGTKTVRNLAVSSLLYSHTCKIRLWNLNMMNYWLHSFIVADLAHDFCRVLRMDPDLGYLAGLLHEIGSLVLYGQPQDKAALFSKAHNLKSLRAYEQGQWGVDNVAFSKLLLERWNIPQPIVQAVADHQNPKTSNRLACLINLANELASAATDFYYQSDLNRTTYRLLLRKSMIPEDKHQKLLELIPAVVVRSKTIMKIVAKSASFGGLPRRVQPLVSVVTDSDRIPLSIPLLTILGFRPMMVTLQQIQAREDALKELEEAERRERLAMLQDDQADSVTEELENGKNRSGSLLRRIFSREEEPPEPDAVPAPPSVEELKAKLPPAIIWNPLVIFDHVKPFEIPRRGLKLYSTSKPGPDFPNVQELPFFFSAHDIPN